jgi:hypothetical protein
VDGWRPSTQELVELSVKALEELDPPLTNEQIVTARRLFADNYAIAAEQMREMPTAQALIEAAERAAP